ncbi:hypothetical protein BDZ97DRAFT_1668514 [Flammula alnicola]|nr:hypothetical protein BDZ97DRAFT_1668514 [Flammula alnicola]
MLIWIKGCLNPQEMRDKILSFDSEWNQKLTDWLESCYSGDFMTGNKEKVTQETIIESKKSDYKDPTQTIPEAAPPLCTKGHDSKLVSDCKTCSNWKVWYEKFKQTVDDLLLKSNLHDCERDNKWGKCKARFPRAVFENTSIDKETGGINMKKSEPWLNTFTHLVTYLFRCNTDVTNLSSGTAIKAVVLYVSDYITKTTLKTHTIFDSIRSVFHKNSEMIGGTLPMKEKTRRLMTKVVNLLTAKMEMGAPMICMYLLDNPDHYTVIHRLMIHHRSMIHFCHPHNFLKCAYFFIN